MSPTHLENFVKQKWKIGLVKSESESQENIFQRNENEKGNIQFRKVYCVAMPICWF